MSPEELFCTVSWVSELSISVLNLTLVASILSYIYTCGSGSTQHLNSEYGFNTDPDPQHGILT